MASSTPEKKPYFSIPSDPSFIHPVSDFPPLSLFDTTVVHAALLVPVKRTGTLRKTLSNVLLQLPKTKCIYAVEGHAELRTMVLRQATAEEDNDILKHPDIVSLLAKDDTIQTSTFTLASSYSNWTVDQVLRKLLPFPEVPSSFEIVGPIAHVNLKDEWLPFSLLIGKVFLDKNQPRIQTVVNKTGSINTQYRTFGMEIIAGDSSKKDWSIVTMKEEGCQFTLDFQRVYWNSRLGGEHERLVALIRKTYAGKKIVVADIMAGVGPFAVPLTAAKFNNTKTNPAIIVVHANDLNPSSYHYLKKNMNNNKCSPKHLKPYQMDGRAFVHYLQDNGIDFHHAIMNLPATAPEFLNAFRGFTNPTLPYIHVHCFGGKDEHGPKDVIARCSKALGCDICADNNAKVHLVRNVAPKKNMFCVSFVLPEAARLLPRIVIEPIQEDDDEAPDAKKARIEE